VSLKRGATIVVLLVVVAGVFFFVRNGSGAVDTTAQPQAAGATSAVQLQLLNGTAQQNNAPTDTGDFYTGSRTDPPARAWIQLTAATAGPLNPAVVNATGRTVYRFDKDTANPPKSNCDGDCAQKWPPLLVEGSAKVFVEGVDKTLIGSVKRADGTNQATLNGWPMYLFSGDSKAGDVNGQGVDGTWFAIAPDGSKAVLSQTDTDQQVGLTYTTGTAQQNNATADTGDFYRGPSNSPAAMKWVQLTAGSAGGLNPIVHNAVGRTMYRFDKDTPKPPQSNCLGACVQTWEPVLVQQGGRIFVDGVATARVGILNRDDGTRQVTLGGWPMYYYSGDRNPGDTNGEGVDGTWYAISPTGGKIER
jgi:predicted lipoprotein with Yx(FWY)xxD motif